MSRKPKLEVKTWSSPDVELESWVPDAPNEVYFLLELEIGVVGEERRDIFQVVVATPEGLRARARANVIAERGTLVVSEYSWRDLRRSIQSIVERCESPTWSESALKLQRYFEWEYEDYVGGN